MGELGVCIRACEINAYAFGDKGKGVVPTRYGSLYLEIALVLVSLDHIACIIVNADRDIT
jgi:hypothetical protein